MILLLLLGCYTTFFEDHCTFEEREISDDEELAALDTTLAHVLLALADPREVDALGLDGAAVPLVVTLARGEGPAMLDDATIVHEEVHGSGRNSSTEWVGAVPNERCRDAVAVPVVLTIEGEGVRVSGDAWMTNGPDDFPGVLEVIRPLDLATEALPAGWHGAPGAAEVRVAYQDGEVSEIEGIVTAQDGARETVLWHRRAP